MPIFGAGWSWRSAMARGPRPKFDRAATQTIRVRVTPEQRRDLDRVARDNNSRMADVIRDAVNEFVNDYGERRVFRGP